MVEPTVVNVVGTITYQQELALDALAEPFSSHKEISEVTYEPAENHWLQTHFEPDNTYVAFYRSGRCSITGAKSIEHFQDVGERVNRVMQDILQYNYEPTIEVSNIVATADVGSQLSLETLALEFGMEKIEYEPEQFPGLMFHGSDYVILIFASGKLLCTGLKELERVSAAIEEIASRLQKIN